MKKTKDFFSQLKQKQIIKPDVESSVAKLLPNELELSTLPAKISQLIYDKKIQCEMGKMLLQNMAKDEGIKRLISPQLQLQLFCYKVLQLLGAGSQNPEELEAIKENLNRKMPMKEFFSSVYEQFTGSIIQENDLQDLLNEMQSDCAFYKKYTNGQKKEEQEEQKEDDQPKEEKVEVFDGFDLNDLKQYQQELTEDLNEIPPNMDQYKLKKIQIKMCKMVMDRKSEPTQLQQEDREYLQKMDLKHEEATLARNMIFNGKDIRRNLKILRYYRCGIDIQDVFRMIRIGRKKNQQLNQKQKVILFMGLSKAGKTTMITRLVGYDMHLTRINGIYTLQPKNKVNQKHQGLKIGYSNRSTTRYPSSFEVNRSFVQNEAVKVMDSPGFEDTGSVEIEISNRITTIEALKQVSNLQIVIVINQKNWGVSGADVQKLAKTVSSICSNYKSIRKSVTFAFNQFDEKFAESFENQVDDLIRNIKARKGSTNNDSFDCFFEHLLKESRNCKKNLVEPDKLDQTKFFERLLEKDWIQNPRILLVCDIGVRAKDEVKKLCKRYVAEFQTNYQKKQLREAQYCLEMLKKMQDESDLQSDSEYEIQQILNKLKKSLENKYNKINNEFQQLFTRTINDKKKRGENYKRLKEQFSEFEKQIQKYRAIDGKYEKDLRSIYEEVESFYVIKMNEWKSQECSLHKLQQATITGIEFFQFFLPEKSAAFKDKLTNQASEIQSHVTLQIKNLNQSNSFSEDLKKFTALCEVLGEGWDPCIFENQIKQEFQKRVGNVRFIDFTNFESTKWSDWIKQEFDYDNQFSKLNHLTDLLSAVLKYPKQVIKQQEMIKIQLLYRYIVQTLPKNIVKEFENETKVEQMEEEEETRQQKMHQKMQEQQNKKQIKINKIKTLMRWMKGLNSIQVIRKFDDNRFEKTFLGLNSMIEHSMAKFSSVGQALSQNNLQKMKLIMRTAKSEFKQLKSLVSAADKQELTEKFNKMEEKVIQGMQQYIMKNDYEGVMRFTKPKELLQCIESYKNLKQFKTHLFLDNQNLKADLDKKFKSYETKILEPINNYSLEIQELKQKGNKFKVSRHESYLIYCEKIKDVGNSFFSESFKKQTDSKQNEVKRNCQDIINNLIKDPLTAFTTKLYQIKQLNLETVQSELQEQFKANKISKIKRAFEFLSQILRSEKVSECYEGEDLKEIQQTNLGEQDQLQKNIRQKIETNQLSINSLELMQKIVDKISIFGARNEAICQQYKFLSSMIRGRQGQLNQSNQARKQQLIDRYKGSGNIDEEVFIGILKILGQDKTENGEKSRSQLMDLFQKYRRDTDTQLSDLKELMYEDSSDYLLKSLKILNKFCSFANKIKQDFKDQPIANETKLSNYEDIIKMIDQAIPSFLDAFQNIFPLTTKQFQQLIKQTSKIEKQINELARLDIIFVQVRKYREQKNTVSFVDFLKNQKKLKDDKIKQIKSDKNLGNLVDENFATLFSSLQEPQLKEVANSIKKYFQSQIKIMSEIYYQDCEEYDKRNSSLDNFLRNLPTELSLELADKKDKQINKIQKGETEQIKEIFQKKEENDSDQLLNILNFCEKRKKSRNIDKVQRQFLSKYDYVKKEDNEGVIKRFLNDMLWKHKDQFSSIQILNKQYQSLQKGCIERISHLSVRCWKNVFDNYKNGSQNDWDSSQNDDLSESKSVMITSKITKPRSRIVRAIDCYETVTYGIENGYVLKQNLQLITKCRTEMEKSISALIKIFITFRNGFKQINEGIISKQSSMANIFCIYSQILQDTAALKGENNYSSSLKSVLLKEFNPNDFQKEIYEQRESLFKKVEKLSQLKFEYFNDSLKNQSEKDSQKRVTQFEQKINFLQNLMNAGYNKLNPPSEIRIQDEIVKNLEKEAEKNTELVLKYIDKIVDPEDVENDTINEQVNSVPKIMQVINSKQRLYMPKENHLKTIQTKLNEVFNKVKQDYNKSLTILQSTNKKTKDEFNAYSKKEEDNAKILISEQQKKHKQKQEGKKEQFRKKLQNMSGEDKKKMEKQRQSELKVIESESDRKIEQINQNLRDKKQKFTQSKKREEQNLCKEFLCTLIVIKKLSLVFLIKDEVNRTISSGLKKLAKTKFVQNVFELLSNSELPICEQIKESDAFQKMRGQEFCSKTVSSNNIQFVLQKMRRQGKIDHNLKQRYTSFYKVFDQEQNKYIENYKKSRDITVIHTLKMKIKEEGFAMQTKLKQRESIHGSQKVSVLAKIFALWSISISESDGEDEQQFFVTYKAHAAQITAILLIICIQSDQNSNGKGIPTNRLAEVKTGEGKSIVLAGLSIYFALLGYDVDCCCYSETLSKRDEISFSKLFKDCGVDKKIKYGIFDHVIRNLLNKKSETEVFKLQDTIKQALLADEGLLNSLKGSSFGNVLCSIGNGISSIGYGIVNLFKGKLQNFKDLVGGEGTKKVLIIDQIDVLFDKSYFGETFNQTIEIKDPTIKQLFLFIWQNQKTICYRTIKESNEFKSVVAKYKPLRELLKNQIYGMLAALETYQEQQYTIIDRKIMYKVEDTFKEVSYGYNTVYAYIKEYYNSQISEAALNQHLSITLCVSQFSYSRIPEFYTHIVGVTGTLVCLPQYIKDYLRQNYKIFEGDMYPIPSVYSKETEKEEASNRTIFEAIATTQEDHYEKIIANLEPEFTKGRPILIFFRSKSELLQFYSSPLFAKYLKNTSYLTEEHNTQQRQDRISRSSRKSTITLMTSSYIRGIDFKLNNKMAKTLGGFHAVVTYVIQSIADFIQVTGRVARQGQDGSIIQIFPASQLTLLSIDQKKSPSNDILKKKRLQKQQQEKDTCLQRLSAANKRHQQTMKVFNDDQINQSKLIEYVLSKNKYPEISDKKGRLLFLVDATVSMDSMFAKLKLILPNIFSDVYDTLKKRNFKGQLQIQIVFYRNYNVSSDKLMEISPFDTTGNSLKQFVTNSKVDGGWGNEAIEVGLQYASFLEDIGEIFIIGDARGNTPAEVKQKRQKYPNLEAERIQKGLYLTTTEDQQDKLVKKGVRISSFYLSKSSQVSNYFEKLAACSGGKAVYVDITTKQSADTMTQIVAESGLKLIGGSKDGDALLQEYKQILKRRMAK